MTAEAAAEAGASPGARGRLVGVDVARGIALLAMMATHFLPLESGGGQTLTGLVASGRASATFAVLAGVGLALLTGGSRPVSGTALRAARRGVLGRAAVITGIGALLGLWPSGVAVILVNYGALFAVAALFLALRTRALLPLAVGWLVASPVLSHLLRQHLPPGPGPVPSLLSLLSPLDALTQLLLTGYYPVLTWTGYLLLGMAVGRLDLRQGWVSAAAAVGGGVAAALAWWASAAALQAVGGVRALAVTLPRGEPLRSATSTEDLQHLFYGTTPTTSWDWLVVRAPHSGTPFDLVHTAGCALAVLGLCLLLTRWRPAAALATPLAAVGAMTLTLYTVHVMAKLPMELVLGGGLAYAVQVVLFLAAATAWRLAAHRGVLPRRGPLEQVAAAAALAARGGGR